MPLASPDQSTASVAEKTSSKIESKPTGIIKEGVKSLIERIRSRITGPNPDPDAALVDIITAPDSTPDNANTADVQPPLNDEGTTADTKPSIPELDSRIPLDPEAEYQKALTETQLIEEDPFTVFSRHTKLTRQVPTSEIPPREFTLQDKVRHQKLAAIARLQGVKGITSFNRLVEYFESSYTSRQSSYIPYKKNLSEDGKQKMKAAWEAKGYETDFYDSSNKLTIRKEVPFNIKVDNIAEIKAMLETGIDPVPVLEAQRLNSTFNSSTYRLFSNKLMGLLRDPNLPLIVPLMQNMTGVPHRGWDLDDSAVDELRELAEKADVSSYSEEFFKKVSIVAKALDKDVKVAELPIYHELINNPDKLNLLAAFMEGGLLTDTRSGIFYLFDTLNELERDNLLKPLTILIKSGVKIDQPIFSARKSYREKPEQAQNQLNLSLLQFIVEPSVAGILQDQDKQAFARILRKMNGKPVSAELIEKLSPARQDLVTINNLIFHSLDEPYQESYYDDGKLERLETLLESEERRKILVSPEFQKFIAKLGKDIDLKPADFFREEIDIFKEDQEKQNKYEALLVTLFKAQGIIDIIDPGIFKRILRPSDDSYNQYTEIYNLQRFLKFNDTIQLLREAGIPLNPDNFKDADWISNISRMPLRRFIYINIIPPDRRAEWIRAILDLPESLQQSLGDTLQREKGSPFMREKDFAKVVKIAELISTSDFFPKDKSTYVRGTDSIYHELAIYQGDIDTLFTKGVPNIKFAKLLIEKRKPAALSLVLNSEMLKSFNEPTRSVLGIWLELPFSIQESSGNHPDFPNLHPITLDRYRVMGELINFTKMEYLNNETANLISRAPNYKDFLVNGLPTLTFIKEIARRKNPSLLLLFLTEEVLSQYSDFEKSVIKTWLALPVDLKNEVLNETPDFPNVPVNLAEKYRVAAEVITRIRNSPSAEIKKIEKELIGQLWKLDNPRQALDEIIGIFEKNNLPIVGKVYRVFETIYDNPGTSGKSTLEVDLLTKPNLSPVLKAATPAERRGIIYKDLLSINIQSGNPQLRDYLEAVRDGEAVVAEMEKSGVDALSEREKLQLGHFFDKMDMLYTTSLFGRTIESRRRARNIDSSPTTSHLDLEKRAEALKRNLRVRQGQKLTERLSEMFLKPLGLSSIEEVLAAMAKSKQNTDTRNRHFAQSGQGKIVLKAGDRFKGVGSINLEKILERGIVAREYLGASAASDTTPYDSDTSLILEQDLNQGVPNAVAASMSSSYGDLLLLIRGRGQFGPDQHHYESFSSGGENGERHFGIRTGFASTEIDAIVLHNNSLTSNTPDNLYMTIAQHGVYIPVCDKEGKIIFTPEQFDEYRKTFDGVSEYSNNPATVRKVGIDESAYPFPSSAEVVATTRNTLDQLVQEISADRRKVVDLSNEIRKKIAESLAASGVTLRGEFDTSIYGAEFVDTGSTARGSNVPGAYDFDMSLQLDPNDSKRLAEIADVVKIALKLQQDASHAETDYIQVRGMGSQIIEGETLDIDIGVGKRSDEGIFASNDSLSQKLESIRIIHGDAAYLDVLANIVLAKKVLKAGNAYKKLEDGGMGGIGVENWILLHNGNILEAFQSFWQAAHNESGEIIPYEEFAKKYKVFDAGLNIKFNRHDNFIRVLKPNGYSAMLTVIGRYLGYT